jgi:hypothetical protein
MELEEKRAIGGCGSAIGAARGDCRALSVRTKRRVFSGLPAAAASGAIGYLGLRFAVSVALLAL